MLTSYERLCVLLLRERRHGAALFEGSEPLRVLGENFFSVAIENSYIVAPSVETAYEGAQILRRWKALRELSAEKIIDNKAIYMQTLGNFLTYPSCCVKRFAQDHRENIKSAIRFAQEADDISAFAAVPYIPCTPKCQETQRRDYSCLVQQKDPELLEELIAWKQKSA